MADTRNTRRTLVGTVISDKTDKTITVRVERAFRHPKYGKIVRRHKKYRAHDEAQVACMGDRVEITATRPLSKTVRWRLERVLVASAGYEAPTTAENPEALRTAAAEGESS